MFNELIWYLSNLYLTLIIICISVVISHLLILIDLYDKLSALMESILIILSDFGLDITITERNSGRMSSS